VHLHRVGLTVVHTDPRQIFDVDLGRRFAASLERTRVSADVHDVGGAVGGSRVPLRVLALTCGVEP